MPQLPIVPRGFLAGVADRIARAATNAALATNRRLHASAPPPARKSAAMAPAAPWFAMDYVQGATWAPRDYTAFAREGFMQNAIVYRSVRMIAEAAGSIPLCLYDGDTEIEDHPLLDLLRAPTATSTRAEFMEAFVGFLLVSGNAYIEATAVGDAVRELHVLRPDRIQIVPGSDGYAEAYDYTVDGLAPVRLDGDTVPGVRRVMHQKLFHPLNDHYGLSPIEAAATAIDIHNAASRWNKALLDNSARPSGALVYTSRDGNLSTEQYERLKAELASGFQGAGNAGRPLLLEGGLDWKTMSMSPKDLDFMEAKHGAAREIALALGVPPMLLGIPGDNTFSNYQEANRTFWRSTVLPLAQRIVGALNGWLTPVYPGTLCLDIDVDDIPALSSETDTLWTRLNAATFLTADEKRSAAGYGPAPLDQKFSPGRSRAPSGRPNGGQWTKPGGDSGGGNPEDGGPTPDPFGDGLGDGQSSPEIPSGGTDEILDPPPASRDSNERPRPIADRMDEKYIVSLEEEERSGGHTIRDHVGKSNTYLISVVEEDTYEIRGVAVAGKLKESSFASMDSANDFVNRTIQSNIAKVDRVASGDSEYEVLNERFGYATGKEAHRDTPTNPISIRDTYEVRVVLRHDARAPYGYIVYTAFPYNRLPK